MMKIYIVSDMKSEFVTYYIPNLSIIENKTHILNLVKSYMENKLYCLSNVKSDIIDNKIQTHLITQLESKKAISNDIKLNDGIYISTNMCIYEKTTSIV